MRKLPYMKLRETATFGQRLKYALELAEKERKDLAAALKTSVQAIGQVISGKTVAMTADNCARAARFLGVSAHWLATGEGAPHDREGHEPPVMPFRDLNAMEAQVVTFFRQLDAGRQHDLLVFLNDETQRGITVPSSANPFAGVERRDAVHVDTRERRRASDDHGNRS